MKNWKEIVQDFTIIESVIIQPNKKSIRAQGSKNGNFHDAYIDYKYETVAKEVYTKVSYFIGIK